MNWESVLQQQKAIILDGALATGLEARGARLDDALWSAKILLEQPAMIRRLHLDYFRAGADVATTASYQASFEGFRRRGLSHQEARGLMQRSVELAKEARELFWAEPDNRAGRIYPLVAASVGPYGAFLADGSEYEGRYGLSVPQLMDWHRPRLEALLAAGPDLLACETIPCPEEAEALLRLLEEFPEARAWLSFSCRDGRYLSQGEPLREVANMADGAEQVRAVGVNCTPPRYISPLLEEAAAATRKPLVAYPNSGERWDAARRCWIEGERESGFGTLPLEWFARGARLIGGCCRTGTGDVRRMRTVLLEGDG
ncbi:MAG: homocysteine S-methyltransferase [Phaeodactylibacter sp.]|nr:homocysteine S-methyltransferase [Phaeodactylibacter sp.]